MGNTVRDISSHSQFGVPRMGEPDETLTDEADREVESAEIRSITTERPDLTMKNEDINRMVGDGPAIDREKIEDIKARIDNGTYSVNARSIVDKLLQTEDLLK